ncbi:MAG: DUF6491 family protein [Caulobacteraceae bacterium]
MIATAPFRLTILAGLAASLAGAALAPPPAARQACFYAKNADNFVAVDDRTVNVRVGVGQVYRLKLFASCVGVAFAQSIALRSSPGSFICSGSGNGVDLFIRTSTGPQRCPVTAIRKLSAAEIAAMPKKQRP